MIWGFAKLMIYTINDVFDNLISFWINNCWFDDLNIWEFE